MEAIERAKLRLAAQYADGQRLRVFFNPMAILEQLGVLETQDSN